MTDSLCNRLLQLLTETEPTNGASGKFPNDNWVAALLALVRTLCVHPDPQGHRLALQHFWTRGVQMGQNVVHEVV